MINKPIDLLGLLRQTWRGEWAHPDLLTVEHYETAKQALENAPSTLTSVNIDDYFYVLDPISFNGLIRGKNGEPTEPHLANTVIPPILRILQLRRTMAHSVEVNGREERIGEAIKPYKIVTVELQMSQTQSKHYFKVHNLVAACLRGGKDEDTDENFISMEKHRHLSHVVALPLLAALRNKSNTAKVSKWYHRYPDNGASMLFEENRPLPYMSASGDRVSMTNWMAGESAKMQWLIKYAYDTCIVEKRKLLLFFNWPVTLWYAESLLQLVGFKTCSVRAAHKREDRETMRRQFNDPDHEVQIMLTSIRVSSSSVNLHHACADVVFVDVPPNASEMFQAIGRVFRLGQVRMGRIVILTLDQTYDGTLQCRAASKMIGNIAAQSKITVSQTDLDEARPLTPDTQTMSDEDLKNFVLENKAAALYTRVTGQRSPRHEWVDSYDVLAKNTLSVEKAFRKLHRLSFRPPPGFLVVEGRQNHIGKSPVASTLTIVNV